MTVEVACRGTSKKYLSARLRRTVEKILRILHRSRGGLSLALVDDHVMRELNGKYRRKRGTTDVLSFPFGGYPVVREPILGDVVISVEQAERQARQRRRALTQELEALLIHGILHLVGYDHERSAKEARRMARREAAIAKALAGSRQART